jgi:hypothetical protein
MSRTFIREATPNSLGEVSEKGIVPLVIASPGWGSSGWYGPKVLENAAKSKVFGKDLHLYMDHPSESEQHDRPERSVRDLVAVLDSDARWDPQQGLMAEAKIFKPYRDLFRDEDFVKAIGVSLRAYADTTVGEAEGRKGTIITELLAAESVDFVTKAGRGGMVLSALESARTRVDEATSNDTREALNAALRVAYGAEDVWLWLRDFDDTTVWFTREDADSSAIYQQAYALADNGTAVLADGDPIEVRARTEYVPVAATTESSTSLQITRVIDALLVASPLSVDTIQGRAVTAWINEAAPRASLSVPAPAGQPITQESKEDTIMPEISEAQLANLTEAAGRVPTLESEREQAIRERDEAREALAQRDRGDLITATINAVEGANSLTALERDGLAARVPAGDVDTAALTAAVEAAVAESAQRAGAGAITGFGATGTTTGGTITATESTASIMAAFGITQEG